MKSTIFWQQQSATIWVFRQFDSILLGEVLAGAAGRTINTGSQHWETPHKYVKAVREMFRGTIDLDPCSNQYSIVGAKVEFALPKHDGLTGATPVSLDSEMMNYP